MKCGLTQYRMAENLFMFVSPSYLKEICCNTYNQKKYAFLMYAADNTYCIYNLHLIQSNLEKNVCVIKVYNLMH